MRRELEEAGRASDCDPSDPCEGEKERRKEERKP